MLKKKQKQTKHQDAFLHGLVILQIICYDCGKDSDIVNSQISEYHR